MRIKDWHKFQHFKDRKPPWVKLYRDILDDIDWHNLDAEAAKVLVMLWLIASEDDGCLPSITKIAFRLRMPEKKLALIIKDLSHWIQDDIKMISERYQDDAPETETETETDVSSFEIFWKEYPKKVNRKNAEKAYAKVAKHHDAIMAGLARAKQKWQDPNFIPHAATWLHGERWLDEDVVVATSDAQKVTADNLKATYEWHKSLLSEGKFNIIPEYRLREKIAEYEQRSG